MSEVDTRAIEPKSIHFLKRELREHPRYIGAPRHDAYRPSSASAQATRRFAYTWTDALSEQAVIDTFRHKGNDTDWIASISPA